MKQNTSRAGDWYDNPSSVLGKNSSLAFFATRWLANSDPARNTTDRSNPVGLLSDLLHTPYAVNPSAVHENQKLTERLKRGELPTKFRKKRPANFLCPFLQPSRFFGLTLPATTTALVLPHVREVSRHICNSEAETIVNHSKMVVVSSH